MPELSKSVHHGKLILSEDQMSQLSVLKDSFQHAHGYINAPALVILFMLTLLLIRGTKESAFVNAIIVFLKVAIVLVFIIIGWNFINQDNYTPYMIPEGTKGHEGFFDWGWGGVLGGAGIVFFAFIGFLRR